MPGIVEIETLLKEMKPRLDNVDYVFSSINCFELTEKIVAMKPVATFLETEGMTVVITKEIAEKHVLPINGIFNRITLEVHSSLDAVGLTAAISTALTSRNISANVIAGYYHDHIFVQKDKAKLALVALQELTI